MAEADATQSTMTDDPTADADNEPSATQDSGTERHEQLPSKPLWEDLGYKDADELRATHTRYRQQVSGSAQEVARLKADLDARDRELTTLRSLPSGESRATTTSDKALSFNDAVSAYLADDQETVSRYQQQQDARYQAGMLNFLQQATRPAQYSEVITSKFKDLADPTTPLYKELYEHYDTEARSPRWQLLFPQEDPMAIREVWAPDGSGSKKIDMRIAYVLAHDYAKDIEREAGRREESQRRAGAGGAAATGAGTQRARSEPPAQLLYEDEVVNDPRIIAAMEAAGRPTDAKTRRAKFWQALPAAEKKRRLDAHASGAWTGKRGL